MSSPGFTGAGPSDFFSGGSMAAAPPQNSLITTVPTTTTTTTTTPHLHPSHPLYRTQQNLPAIFLDPSLQQRQTPTLIGKRTLAEFQSHQNLNNSLNYINNNHHLNLHNTNNLIINNSSNNNNHNQLVSSYLLRSVKQRTLSPMSSLSRMDFSISPEFTTSSSGFPSQRHGMPYLNNLRQNPVNFTNSRTQLPLTNSTLPNTNRFTYQNPNLVAQVNNNNSVGGGGVLVTNNELQEKKNMDHRLLQELEKQLLEDNDEEEGDAASVITNSEWSETIQNLIDPQPAQSQDQAQAQAQVETQTQAQKLVSSSPTSSTTSSNSSSCSVASPASNCSKQSLMEAATAIYEGKMDSASEILSRLAQSSNPNGNSDQRFTDCMVSALKSRVNPVENPAPVAELFSREHAESTQLLFENCLCFKVALMAANHAILEAALEDKAENGVKFCVLDFDVGNGKQHASLLHTLSARLGGKPATVKLAAVSENGTGDERMKSVGELLLQQAERLGIGFEFKIVTHNEFTRESLGCSPDESLAVNFAFKLYRMPDESVSTENPRDELLRRVKALAPRVVTLVEQEMNTNTAPFGARVSELCSYYGALFDSVESTLGRDNSVRVKVEEGLSRRVGNSVACEGRDRVERCEVFGKWRARMGWAGFSVKPVNPSVTESIKARLGPGNRVTVKEENGGVCFGWMGRTLTVASTWR